MADVEVVRARRHRPLHAGLTALHARGARGQDRRRRAPGRCGNSPNLLIDRSATIARSHTPTIVNSVFTSRVVSAVRRIPKGRVATYGDVAAMAGRPRA